MRRFLASLILLCLLPLGANAHTEDVMWSVHGGLSWGWDDDAFSEFSASDSLLMLGGGIRWQTEWMPDYLSIQGELGVTADDGRWREESLDVTYGAGFATLAYGDRVRLLLRGGVSLVRVDVGGATATDSGLAGGVGLGLPMDDYKLEVHLTSIDRNINYLGFYWRF